MKGCAVWPYGILLLKSQWSLSNMCWPLPMHKNEMSLVLWLFMAFRLAQHFAVLDAASIWQSSRANDTLAAQQWRRGGLKLIFYIGTRIIETFIVIASIVDRCPCSLAARTPVNYEYDSRDLTDIFVKSLMSEKVTNEGLLTTHPCDQTVFP